MSVTPEAVEVALDAAFARVFPGWREDLLGEAAVERAALIIQEHALNTAASFANVKTADWHDFIRIAKQDPEGWQGDLEAARAALAAAMGAQQ